MRTVPGSTNGDWDPSVGTGANNTVYLGYGDGDGHPKVSVSHDHGATWGSTRDVGVPFGIKHTAFPAMVAGDDDRAAFAFLGSSERVGRGVRRQPGLARRLASLRRNDDRRRQHMDDRRRDAERPGSARHDLRRRHDRLRQRHAQPARLHGRHRRQRRPRAGRLRRRLHRRVRGSRAEQLQRAGDDRTPGERAEALRRSTTSRAAPCRAEPERQERRHDERPHVDGAGRPRLGDHGLQALPQGRRRRAASRC